MLIGTAGFILLLRRQSVSASWRLPVAAVCAVIAVATGVWNEHLFRRSAGYDGRSIRNITEIASLFPAARTMVVTQGYEGWLSWEFVLIFKGDWDAFRTFDFDLFRPFVSQRGIGADEAANVTRKQIDSALASGRQVVACALWTEAPKQFVASLSTLTDEDRLTRFDSVLRASYRTGKQWTTSVGRFVELLPITSSRVKPGGMPNSFSASGPRVDAR
jgi:hypothetical protein